MRGDEFPQQLFAFRGLKVDDLHAAFAQPVDAALESARLPDDHGTDLELHDEAAAVPAGRQCRHHDGTGIPTLTSGLAERVGLAVYRGISVLHAAVAAGA